MVAHSILSALAVAAALTKATLGASVSGPTRPDISPRGWFGSGTTNYQAEEIIQQWSRIPTAFSQCQSVFQRRVDVSVAIEAVRTLYTEVQSLSSTYSSCSCNQINEQTTYTFKETISQVFITWQSLLVTGREFYGARWANAFKLEFEKFSGFLSVVKSLSASLQIDLSVLLPGLGIDVGLFVTIGIDVNVLLGGVLSTVTGTLSGLLDGPKRILGGLLSN